MILDFPSKNKSCGLLKTTLILLVVCRAKEIAVNKFPVAANNHSVEMNC